VTPVRRIAIVGTFDVSNFGDLLFPLVAKTELEERIEGIEIRRYSYRRMQAGTWPYEVRSLGDLADDIAETDLLIVGGGHLVRFDKSVADGYEPTEPDTHHPTGYWLAPTLLARAYGVPIAWNALGVSPDTPAWARPLLAEAVSAADYVSVRDEPSARELAALEAGTTIRIVPDTAWGVHRHADGVDLDRYLEDVGVSRPYVLVQPSPLLLERAADIRAAARAARELGRSVLELPISPALGDRPGLLALEQPVAQPEDWPAPKLLAEVIANADAAIAQSLHLSIAALAAGVPVHRVKGPPGSKYEVLETLDGVSLWNGNGDAATIMRTALGRREPGQEVTERMTQLAAHWDAIAALVGEKRVPDTRLTARALTARTAGLEAAVVRDDVATEAQRRIATLEEQLGRLSTTVEKERLASAEARLCAEERTVLLEQLEAAEHDRAALVTTQQELRRLSEFTQTLLASPGYRLMSPLRRVGRSVLRR
jgi:lipopolysaccharide transport system ATP-binding protein